MSLKISENKKTSSKFSTPNLLLINSKGKFIKFLTEYLSF